MRTEVVATAVGGAAGVVLLAVAARAPLGLGPMYPAKAAACWIVVVALAWRAMARHHPFPHVGWANRVTLLRAALVALVAGTIGERPTDHLATAVVAVALVATALDGVDGWLARRHRTASTFGARFDMEVDAFLILILAVLVWQHGKAGPWILLAGLLRYLFVAGGWLAPWMQQPLPPSVRRKAICVVQIGGLIVALLPMVPTAPATLIAAVTLVALVYSFVVDTRWLWRSDRREQMA